MTEFNPKNNQAVQELELLQAYEGGPLGPVMAYNLNQIKRFAGYSIPQYSNVEVIGDEPVEVEQPTMTEDIGSGYVEFGSVYGPSDMATLQVREPLNLAQEEFDALSDSERTEFLIVHNGTAAIGDKLPDDVQSMFDDINGLINAELVRDDSQEPGGKRDGVKLYKGNYDNVTIYTEEGWSTFVIDGREYTARSLRAFGENSGESVLNSLSMHDIAQIEMAGGSGIHARRDGVTRQTLNAYIGQIKEINEIGQ